MRHSGTFAGRVPALHTDTLTLTAAAEVLHNVAEAIFTADEIDPDPAVYWVVSPAPTNCDTNTCGKLLVAVKRFCGTTFSFYANVIE
jgi:hypothetical protein